MAEMTLSEAAKWAGKGRPTVWRAIKQGKLSARRNDDGQWMIDPAELARVYQAVVSDNVPLKQGAIAFETPETAALQQIIALLERQLEDTQAQREDLKKERDRLLGMVESQTRLITHLSEKPTEPTRHGWWRRLTGKG
jgi:Helix-turn-helix domain